MPKPLLSAYFNYSYNIWRI